MRQTNGPNAYLNDVADRKNAYLRNLFAYFHNTKRTMKISFQFWHRCVARRKPKIVEDDVSIRTTKCSETSKIIVAGVGDTKNDSCYSYARNSTSITNDTKSPADYCSPSLEYNESTTCPPREIIIAQNYIDILNSHNSKLLMSILSSTAMYNFNGVEVLSSSIVEVHEHVEKSFPDFHLPYERIEVISPGVVKIINIRATGTHTGVPYTFGPYEAIEATGVKVQNDPEDNELTIDMETELIKNVSIIAKGPLGGPQGFYEQIGGLII
jgi:hypothetical protein